MAKPKTNTYSMVKMQAYCSSPEEYDIFDYRSLRPKYFVEKIDDEGNIDEAGVHFISQELDNVNVKNDNIEYYTPNNVGILLSITNTYLNKSKIIQQNIIKLNRQNNSSKAELKNISTATYDFIEAFQVSIVFAYTALEAFANLSIPNDYKYEQKNKQKGTIEVFDKTAIERWLPLNIKLGDILVNIYDTQLLRKRQVWSYFKKLEALRHDIIHQKSIDRTEFYKNYFKQDIFKTCQCAEEIINFFYNQHKNKNQTNPLWPWLVNKKNYFPVEIFKQSHFYADPKNFDPEKFVP